jgi:hypothetical protein
MVYPRIHKSSSRNLPIQEKSSSLAPHQSPVPVQQGAHKPLTQEEIENEAFDQNKFEAFGLQLKEKSGKLTPVDQERLGVLQAKKNAFWSQKLEGLQRFSDHLLNIPIHSSDHHVIQAKDDTVGNLSKSSGEFRPNNTGLPDNLKTRVEKLSGYSLDDVRVHYNSPKPAQLQALAYTQGTEIHVAPGQEKHLPHESLHVVQQMQGRVKPTMQMRGVQINDNEGLEKEADTMGAKVVQMPENVTPQKLLQPSSFALNGREVIQMVRMRLQSPGSSSISLAKIKEHIDNILEQIASLREEENSEEVAYGVINFANIERWENSLPEKVEKLSALDDGKEYDHLGVQR